MGRFARFRSRFYSRFDSRLSGKPRDAGGVADYSVKVREFLDKLVTIPSVARQALIAALIDGLDSDGVLTALDYLYIRAAADTATALTNITNETYHASMIGVPTFTADRGFQGSGIGTCVGTGFNCTAGVNFTQDNACYGEYSLTVGQVNKQDIRLSDANGSIQLWPCYPNGSPWVFATINSAAAGADGANADGLGLFIVNRVVNAITVYKDGTLKASATVGSPALRNAEIYDSSGDRIIAASFAGAALASAPLRAALKTRLDAYFTGVSAI